MPDVRVGAGILPRRCLGVFLTGMTLVGGTAVASAAAGSVHNRSTHDCRPRARRCGRRHELDRIHQLLVGRGDDGAFVPMAWPVEGAVTSPFGWRQSPFGGQCEWHPGIDITAAYGTPVRATADGAVVLAGRARGYGVLVVLDHGTATTRYAHLATASVHVGQAVRRGDAVGTLGETGRATAPHLHYELRIGEEAVDPEPLLVRSAASTFAAHRWDACAFARGRPEDRRAIRIVNVRDGAGR
jgi:hypothetical protein